MSANKQKVLHDRSGSLGRTSDSYMSGAELLVLQQNIKQYVITSQTRPLTAHELEEFEKIREQLLPSLLRYSEGSGGSSSKSENPTPQLTRKSQISTSAPQGIYPASQTSGRASALQTPTKPKSKTKSKHVTIKPTSSYMTLQPIALPRSTSTTSLATNTSKAGENKKRSRVEVYQDQDPEDTTQKHRRRKTAKGGEDSDKENRNPLDPLSPKSGNRVLKENTNIIHNTNINNNKSTSLSDLKGKAVDQKSIASKKSTTLAPKNTTKTSKVAPDVQQQKQTLGSTVRESTTVPTKVKAPPKTSMTSKQLKNNRIEIRKDADPLNRGNTFKENSQLLSVKQEPSSSTKTAELGRQICLQDDDDNETTNVNTISTGEIARNGVIDRSMNEPQSEAQLIGSPKSLKTQSEVLPSIDDDTAPSFEPYTKRGKVESSASRRKDIEPEVVQGSEDSEEISGSQELTVQMPEFLSEGLPEDEEEEATCPMPDFLRSGLPEDQQEEATCPMPEFLQDELFEDQDDVRVESNQGVRRKSAISLDIDMEARESSALKDGVWCITDIKSGTNTTTCGNKERWITFESDSNIQFWGLDNQPNMPDSKWLLHIQLNKHSKESTRITFAPDDTFAIVLNMTERSFYKVPLNQDDSTEQLKSSVTKVTWDGPMNSFNCDCLIIENPNDPEISHQLVFGDTNPGNVCMVPIPSDVDIGQGSAQEKNVASKALYYMDTNNLASSIVKVENTSSLILASFGETLVLWDLMDCSKPVSVSDTSFIPSISSSVCHSALPIVMSAAVPIQFFKEYEEALQSKTLPPSEWPILSVLMTRDSEVDDSENNEVDRCALYVMKGDKMELIHTYHGTHSVVTAFSTSKYIACQTRRGGVDSLYLWDILKPEALIRFSSSDTRSLTSNILLKQPVKRESPNPDTTLIDRSVELQRGSEDTTDLFSSASTLSPPPAVLSSSPDVPFDVIVGAPESRVFDLLPEPAISTENQQQRHRKPTEWIDLTSVSWIGAKRTQFTIQREQRWVVVEQQDTAKQIPPVVHIMDLLPILDSVVHN